MSSVGKAVFVFGACMCAAIALMVLCYEFAGKMNSRGVRAAKFCALVWMLVSLAGMTVWIFA